MNKYYLLLGKVLAEGKTQQNKKGKIKYLLNEQLTLTPADLLDIFESHGIARKKLKEELKLFMQGERNVERYREAGIAWWDYCGQTLVNSYPTYMEKLPPLIERINKEKRNSKNYVLFLGATDAESNQAPCAVSNRGRCIGCVGISAQLRCKPRTAFRHLPPLSDGSTDRLAAKIYHAESGECTHL